MAGYTPPFFGHGGAKVGVDQSAVSVSHCKLVGTLLCRVWTRVYPIVTFTLYFNILERKIPLDGIELTSQLSEGYEVTSELPGRPAVQAG